MKSRFGNWNALNGNKVLMFFGSLSKCMRVGKLVNFHILINFPFGLVFLTFQQYPQKIMKLIKSI